MRPSLSCLPLALLFLAIVTPSYGQSTEAEAAPPTTEPAAPDFEGEVLYYELHRVANISLDCTTLASDVTTYTWEKNGTAVEKLPELSAAVVVAGGVLRAAEKTRAGEALAGNYSCRAGAATRGWQLRALPIAKLDLDVNVVEGQKLKLVCKILGRPLPAVDWTFSNVSELMENATDVEAAFPGRVVTAASEQGVPRGELTLDPAQRTDAGWFRCAASNGKGTAAVSRLRVKDMYAALWPFLGICAEVFILCAIILVYERRRSKPELDDSDTDNHDQKKS